MILSIISILVIFLGITLLYGMWSFNKKVTKEKEALCSTNTRTENTITLKDLENLPPIVANYLQKIGILGKSRASHVTFKHKGKIRAHPKKRWINFTATQYMAAHLPGFIWNAKAFPLYIRDKSINGKGEVKISLLGIKNVAVFNDDKTAQSALGRCLGELMLFPVGFLTETITWEPEGVDSIKATIEVNGVTAEGVFYFDGNGLMERFKAQRYRDGILENFTGSVSNYKFMEGLLVPTSIKAIWNLSDGDFEYFNASTTHYSIEQPSA